MANVEVRVTARRSWVSIFAFGGCVCLLVFGNQKEELEGRNGERRVAYGVAESDLVMRMKVKRQARYGCSKWVRVCKRQLR